MKYEILHLKDYFPALGENGCDATVTAYLADNLTEMGRDHALRPCLVICPGGGSRSLQASASEKHRRLHTKPRRSYQPAASAGFR